MNIIWSGRLIGTFYGYKPGRTYELSDGCKWTQADLTDEPAHRDDPPARLLSNGSIEGPGRPGWLPTQAPH
jgi:hypothetical protein